MNSRRKEITLEVLWHTFSLAGIAGFYYGMIFTFFLPAYAMLAYLIGTGGFIAAWRIDRSLGSIQQLEYKDPLLLEAEKEVDEYMTHEVYMKDIEIQNGLQS